MMVMLVLQTVGNWMWDQLFAVCGRSCVTMGVSRL